MPTEPLTLSGRPAGTSPSTVVARLVGRRAVRSVIVWGIAFGLYVVASVSGYAKTYSTAASRAQLARTLGSNVGFEALIGPARHLETVAGFAAWRCMGVLSLVGAVWALLASTRLLRGEEEAGRWEMLLAGQTTRRRAAALGLAGLAAGWAALWAITAIVTLAEGRAAQPHFSLSASAFFSVAMVSSAGLFLAVGAFAGQLSATRRQAAAIAGGVLGAAYLLRMVADSGTDLRWALWASPLGWVEELHPLTGSRPVMLVPIVAFTGVLAALTVHLAGVRDLGASTLAAPDSAPARTRLLGDSTGLALRLERPVALAWLAALAVLGLVEGLVAQGAASTLSGAATVQRALGRIGGRHGGVDAYLGLAFIIAAVLMAVVAAGQVVATREEEASSRLDNLLVRPVGRSRWLAGRFLTAAGILAAGGLALAVFTWAGAASQSSGVSFRSLIEAGLNTVPPAMFLLGLGTLVHAAAPRLTAAVVYGLVGWSFLIEFLGSAVTMSHWVLDTSLLYHVAPAPAASPQWVSAGVLVGLGAGLALAGCAVFQRRDLAGA